MIACDGAAAAPDVVHDFGRVPADPWARHGETCCFLCVRDRPCADATARPFCVLLGRVSEARRSPGPSPPLLAPRFGRRRKSTSEFSGGAKLG